ncbi:hypothetical protein [Paraflavitalea sp. CAU 1676]|uniref:hypothetical protein n=1 Tax=Paraflavitalea sp. CAU 1676 TaxID=3032598 RepID=UPI0023DC0898|nr:hypothetical protein [Paraflavitalea sp. CAU 1676]MDF2189180.1 hypothetical protein [Paraflavitalea sp. CAU 1676]
MKQVPAIAAFDFVDVKTILRYLCIFAVILAGGFVAGEVFALLVVGVILFYMASKRLFKTIEWWLLWLFCFGFYQGQLYIKTEAISKYVAKPTFLLFLVFVVFFYHIPRQIKLSRYIISWIAFLTLALLSLLYHGQSPFVLITASAFFLVYIVQRGSTITREHCFQLFNLFTAAMILQTSMCILQVAQIIPPSSSMMDDGSGGQFEWVAGLDDVACGTFGPVSGHIVSWFASLMALFLILAWTVNRQSKYLVLAGISLLQFATIDSKTIMGVMILMMLYTFYFLTKHKAQFRLPARRLTSFAISGGVMAFCLFIGWQYYYEYQNREGGALNRSNFNEVYESEIKKSQELVLENIGDWGKIKGFSYVFTDFIESDPFEVFWGYSLQGYNFNGKMSYIESKDTPLMQLNNFTKSRSTFIVQFAQSGLLGFFVFLLALFLWYKFNVRSEPVNSIDMMRIALVKIFLPFTMVAAFVYNITLTSVTLICFSALVSLLKHYSDYIEQQKRELNNPAL